MFRCVCYVVLYSTGGEEEEEEEEYSKGSLFTAASQDDIPAMTKIFNKHPEWINVPVDNFNVCD